MTTPLVFATRRPPWPLDNGARIRAQRLAAGLGKHFDLTLVTFAGGPTYDETTATRAELEEALPGAKIELVPYDGRPIGVRRNALRTSSATWGIYATSGLRKTLGELVARDSRTVLHVDDPGVALGGIGLDAAFTAFSPHNVEHRILRDLTRDLPPHRRLFLAPEWRKVAREERRLWQASDVCVAVSDVDAKTMREGGAQRTIVCPNGTDRFEPIPLPPFDEGAPLRLVFVGSGAFWPYERGLAWFVREVLPRVREDGPAIFDVVGEPPRDPVQAEGVTYHGRVPAVQSFYERAHALVIPVFQGSGTRLKALEAAALGRPVISTELGMEGLPLRRREHYLRAEDAGGFADACSWLRVLLRAGSRDLEAMIRAARVAAEPFFWDRVSAELAQSYEKELAIRG